MLSLQWRELHAHSYLFKRTMAQRSGAMSDYKAAGRVGGMGTGVRISGVTPHSQHQHQHWRQQQHQHQRQQHEQYRVIRLASRPMWPQQSFRYEVQQVQSQYSDGEAYNDQRVVNQHQAQQGGYNGQCEGQVSDNYNEKFQSQAQYGQNQQYQSQPESYMSSCYSSSNTTVAAAWQDTHHNYERHQKNQQFEGNSQRGVQCQDFHSRTEVYDDDDIDDDVIEMVPELHDNTSVSLKSFRYSTIGLNSENVGDMFVLEGSKVPNFPEMQNLFSSHFLDFYKFDDNDDYFITLELSEQLLPDVKSLIHQYGFVPYTESSRYVMDPMNIYVDIPQEFARHACHSHKWEYYFKQYGSFTTSLENDHLRVRAHSRNFIQGLRFAIPWKVQQGRVYITDVFTQDFIAANAPSNSDDEICEVESPPKLKGPSSERKQSSIFIASDRSHILSARRKKSHAHPTSTTKLKKKPSMNTAALLKKMNQEIREDIMSNMSDSSRVAPTSKTTLLSSDDEVEEIKLISAEPYNDGEIGASGRTGYTDNSGDHLVPETLRQETGKVAIEIEDDVSVSSHIKQRDNDISEELNRIQSRVPSDSAAADDEIQVQSVSHVLASASRSTPKRSESDSPKPTVSILETVTNKDIPSLNIFIEYENPSFRGDISEVYRSLVKRLKDIDCHYRSVYHSETPPYRLCISMLSRQDILKAVKFMHSYEYEGVLIVLTLCDNSVAKRFRKKTRVLLDR